METLSEKEGIVSRGGLVGEFVKDREGNMTQIKVLDCIEFFEKGENVDDPVYLFSQMLEICQINYPERELLGYYEAGTTLDVSKPKAFTWPVSEKQPPNKDFEVMSTHPPSLYLVWNTSEKAAESGMAMKMYDIRKGKVSAQRDFIIDQDRDAEMIALTDVLTLECNRTSLTKLERYREGISVLLEKAEILQNYLEAVEKGKKDPDPTILRGMKSLLSRLPLMGDRAQFEDQLLQTYSKTQLYAFLGAMTESTVMMANNSLATSKAQDKMKFGSNHAFGSLLGRGF